MGARHYLRSFFRYIFSGGLATLVLFGLLIVLIEKFHVNPTLSSAISFSVSVIFSYFIQYYWTFKPTGTHKRFMSRFLLVTILTLNINTGLFWFLTEIQRWPYPYSQIFATGTVFLLNFLINHHFTFKSQPIRQN
jgi:putative flippase GtrA